MASYKVQLKDRFGNRQYPVSTTHIVVNSDGESVDDLLEKKQDILISGVNIKTINGKSVLGGGNIEIETGGDVAYREIMYSTTEIYVEEKLKYNQDTLELAKKMKVIPYFVYENMSLSFTSYTFKDNPLSAHLEYYDIAQGLVYTWDIQPDGTPVIETIDVVNRALDSNLVIDKCFFVNDYGNIQLYDNMPIGVSSFGSSGNGFLYTGKSLVPAIIFDRNKSEMHVIRNEVSRIYDDVIEVDSDGNLNYSCVVQIGHFNISDEELSEVEKTENRHNYFFFAQAQKTAIPFYLTKGNDSYLVVSHNKIKSQCTIINNGTTETYKLTADGLCYKI